MGKKKTLLLVAIVFATLRPRFDMVFQLIVSLGDKQKCLKGRRFRHGVVP